MNLQLPKDQNGIPRCIHCSAQVPELPRCCPSYGTQFRGIRGMRFWSKLSVMLLVPAGLGVLSAQRPKTSPSSEVVRDSKIAVLTHASTWTVFHEDRGGRIVLQVTPHDGDLGMAIAPSKGPPSWRPAKGPSRKTRSS